MAETVIQWLPAKARANALKHGVGFADAVTALEDEFAITIADPGAEGEERYVSIGSDGHGRILVTVFAPMSYGSSRPARRRSASGTFTKRIDEKGIRFQ